MGLTKTDGFTAREKKLAQYAKALAHPARIAILQLLLKKQTCICGDIVEELPLSQSTVSHHQASPSPTGGCECPSAIPLQKNTDRPWGERARPHVGLSRPIARPVHRNNTADQGPAEAHSHTCAPRRILPVAPCAQSRAVCAAAILSVVSFHPSSVCASPSQAMSPRPPDDRPDNALPENDRR